MLFLNKKKIFIINFILLPVNIDIHETKYYPEFFDLDLLFTCVNTKVFLCVQKPY